MKVGDGLLVFSDEGYDTAELSEHTPLKVLIVDDDVEVHQLSQIVLRDFLYEGVSLEIISAYSAGEAKDIFKSTNNISIVVLDIVMESETAGLDLVRYVRSELKNEAVRIIIRTGDPGYAPEESVVYSYHIDDYRYKQSTTAQQLRSLVYSNLRSYQNYISLEKHKNGLREVISSSQNELHTQDFHSFALGLFNNLCKVINLNNRSVIIGAKNSAFEAGSHDVISIYTDEFLGVEQLVTFDEIPDSLRSSINEALATGKNFFTDGKGFLFCKAGGFTLFLIVEFQTIPDQVEIDLVNIFMENSRSSLYTQQIYQSIYVTQREMIFKLSEVVENRSKETGNHIRRVSLYSELLAKLYGVQEDKVSLLKHASPMHDIGKIAIPDHILHKPGKLTQEEWSVMQTHAIRGEEMLEGAEIDLFKTAAIIAGSHHEKWNGSGYPRALKGRDIPIEGRIVALADVFDALSCHRCYKKAWPIDEVVSYIIDESGQHFDPTLVQLLKINLESFLEVRRLYPDAD